VFQRQIAKIDDWQLQLSAELFAHRGRDHHRSRLANLLQTRAEIDPGAVNVALLDDDVADVQPHAEGDPPVWQLANFALTQASLDGARAFEGAADAVNPGQKAVPRAFDDLSPGRNRRIDNLVEQCHQPSVRIGLEQVH